MIEFYFFGSFRVCSLGRDLELFGAGGLNINKSFLEV